MTIGTLRRELERPRRPGAQLLLAIAALASATLVLELGLLFVLFGR